MFLFGALRTQTVVASLSLGVLIGGGLASPARAEWQEIDNAAEYRTCLSQARNTPKTAIETAGQWEGLGGGLPARHCRALATLVLGEFEAAAVMLEDMATTGRATAAIKVGLLRQAAQAWSEAGQEDRSMGVLQAALHIDPHDPGLLEDHALHLASQDKMWEAVDDLNAVLDQRPNQVSALVLRAAAYRRLGSLDLAQADLQRAERSEPQSVDVLLEKGALALVQGKKDAARAAWMTILRTVSQNKGVPAVEAAAEVARGNLERMDVHK